MKKLKEHSFWDCIWHTCK